MGQRYVAVIGPGTCEASLAAVAEEVGERLAKAGVVLVSGGLGGAMEAACRGAKRAGGTTLGILPGSERSDANAFVDLAIPTGLGELRNGLVVRTADALIAVGGEFGTLSEIAMALKLGKPVVGIGTWELHRSGQRVDAFPRAATAEEAVRLALGSVK